MRESDWHGCYDESWKSVLSPSSMQHPAKFSLSLLIRLYDYGFVQGWWQPGSIIGDPFGGVACGGIVAAYRGLHWTGVELEPRFFGLAQENIEKHRPALEAMCDPVPRIIQGDSRRFAELAQAAAIVTSPPYAETNLNTDPDAEMRRLQAKIGTGELGRETLRLAQKGELNANSNANWQGYGRTEGQIGELKQGELDAVITSPPYADRSIASNDIQTKMHGPDGKPPAFNEGDGGTYGNTDGQISCLENGNLDAVLTSPPYGANEKSDYQLSPDGKTRARDERRGFRQGAGSFRGSETYGDTEGQIGRLRDGESTAERETYWQAMKLVYQECYKALKYGGIACIVVKDYVQNHARVPLCDQTLLLLESLGFVPVERIRCWLVKEQREPGLFGDDVVKKTERKSFFRRLAEKNGSPRIDWEEILVCKKGSIT